MCVCVCEQWYNGYPQAVADLVHLLLEGAEYIVAFTEGLLELFKFLRVERQLPPQVCLVTRQLLTALLVLHGLR